MKELRADEASTSHHVRVPRAARGVPCYFDSIERMIVGADKRAGKRRAVFEHPLWIAQRELIVYCNAVQRPKKKQSRSKRLSLRTLRAPRPSSEMLALSAACRTDSPDPMDAASSRAIYERGEISHSVLSSKVPSGCSRTRARKLSEERRWTVEKATHQKEKKWSRKPAKSPASVYWWKRRKEHRRCYLLIMTAKKRLSGWQLLRAIRILAFFAYWSKLLWDIRLVFATSQRKVCLNGRPYRRYHCLYCLARSKLLGTLVLSSLVSPHSLPERYLGFL